MHAPVPNICKICQREFTPDPRKKLRGGYEKELCPECLFLCRRQNQPDGPEKVILRILHERLVNCGAADEQHFVCWRAIPDPAMRNPPPFWSESIFGFFLKRCCRVTYVAGGRRESVAEFERKLHAALDPDPDGIRKAFSFDQGHLRFFADEVYEVERKEHWPAVRQFGVSISF